MLGFGNTPLNPWLIDRRVSAVADPTRAGLTRPQREEPSAATAHAVTVCEEA